MVLPFPAGTIRKDKKGYISIKVINHPIWGTRFVKRSHLIISGIIGRKPKKGEIVHHISRKLEVVVNVDVGLFRVFFPVAHDDWREHHHASKQQIELHSNR